jgi:hypothetical protein
MVPCNDRTHPPVPHIHGTESVSILMDGSGAPTDR